MFTSVLTSTLEPRLSLCAASWPLECNDKEYEIRLDVQLRLSMLCYPRL